MGTHSWNDNCPACGFEGMVVCADHDTYFGAYCPVCGYRRWTETEMPSDSNYELAKKLLSEMNAEQIEQALMECKEDDMPLVKKFGGE